MLLEYNKNQDAGSLVLEHGTAIVAKQWREE